MRRAYVRFSTKALRKVFNIPDDIAIRGIEYEVLTATWRVYLKGGQLPEVPEGGMSLPIEMADVK